jgi:hypothetical protein
MDTYITNTIMEWVSSGTNPPAAPDGLTAMPTAVQIPLTWYSSVGATNYNLKRSTTNGGPYSVIANLAGTNFVDTTAVSGTTYYYVASALDQFGESSNSTQIATSLYNFQVHLSVNPARTNLVFSGNGGSSGRGYVVQASTNLATPAVQWPVIGSNTFDGGGNFIFTNASLPGAPPQFYRIKVP